MIFFSLEHAGEQITVSLHLCCGLASLWLSEVSFLHIWIITTRAGSMFLRRLSTKPKFYSEPICPGDSAPASYLSCALASISISVSVNGIVLREAPLAAKSKRSFLSGCAAAEYIVCSPVKFPCTPRPGRQTGSWTVSERV